MRWIYDSVTDEVSGFTLSRAEVGGMVPIDVKEGVRRLAEAFLQRDGRLLAPVVESPPWPPLERDTRAARRRGR
jgi:hypothetical protein